MLKIAVTGNIGSGKTTICKVFESLGIPVFYADIQARECLDEPIIKEKIIEEFGMGVIDQHGSVDRKLIADLVFRDKKKLLILNQIIHPRVDEKYADWIEGLSVLSIPYCIYESAIIFEVGISFHFDYTVMVYAPNETLMERVVKRDGVKSRDVKARLANQMDQEDKKKLADFVINNCNSNLIVPQIISLHCYFNSKAG